MASIYKRTRTQAIPDGAKIVKDRGRMVARWRTKQGKIRSAPLNEAGDRVVVESDKYVIGYTAHDGKRRYVLGLCRLTGQQAHRGKAGSD